MHKVKAPHKLPAGKLASRKKPPMYTLGDLTEAARQQARKMLENPPAFARAKESRSRPPPRDDQQEDSDISDFLNKGDAKAHYGSKGRQDANAAKNKPKSKKINAVHVDNLSYQDMTPEQQAAHDKLMRPQRFTNTVDDLPHARAQANQQQQSTGFADFFGFGGQQPPRRSEDEDMQSDVHRQQKAGKDANDSGPTIKSENGDADKDY